ncbi:hypothetical protein ON010_g14165 [Phytophthora cinnamomi]|nr:hypothetical protein ON010_g14165 [Phytophthora cinnamomi]
MYVQYLDQRDWNDYAEPLTFAINTAQDRIRGETPFYIVHGWDPRSTLEATIPVGCTRRQDRDPRRWRYQIQRYYLQARAQVNTRLQEAIADRADRHNEEIQPHQIEVGSRVCLYLDRVKEGYAHKLAHLWNGPFRVVEKVGEYAMRIQTTGIDCRLFPVVHVSKLKPVRIFPDRPQIHLAEDVTDRFDFNEALLPEDSWIQDLDGNEYEVEKITDMRTGKRTRYGRIHREFLVHCCGYEDPDWVDDADLNYGAILASGIRMEQRKMNYGMVLRKRLVLTRIWLRGASVDTLGGRLAADPFAEPPRQRSLGRDPSPSRVCRGADGGLVDSAPCIPTLHPPGAEPLGRDPSCPRRGPGCRRVVPVLLHGLALFLEILDLGFGQIHLGSETLVIFFQAGPATQARALSKSGSREPPPHFSQRHQAANAAQPAAALVASVAGAAAPRALPVVAGGGRGTAALPGGPPAAAHRARGPHQRGQEHALQPPDQVALRHRAQRARHDARPALRARDAGGAGYGRGGHGRPGRRALRHAGGGHAGADAARRARGRPRLLPGGRPPGRHPCGHALCTLAAQGEPKGARAPRGQQAGGRPSALGERAQRLLPAGHGRRHPPVGRARRGHHTAAGRDHPGVREVREAQGGEGGAAEAGGGTAGRGRRRGRRKWTWWGRQRDVTANGLYGIACAAAYDQAGHCRPPQCRQVHAAQQDCAQRPRAHGSRMGLTDMVTCFARPGVTRDSVEVPWTFHGRPIKLVDTAGIRRYSKRDHDDQIENLSVRDAFRAIDSAQVVVVVVDMSEPKLIHMDLTIAQRVIEEGRALVLAANKSDLAGTNVEFEMQRIQDELQDSLAQVRGVPVVPISALTGNGIKKLVPEVLKAPWHGTTRRQQSRARR